MFLRELNPGLAVALAALIGWLIVAMVVRVISSWGTHRAVIRTRAVLEPTKADQREETLRQSAPAPESEERPQ